MILDGVGEARLNCSPLFGQGVNRTLAPACLVSRNKAMPKGHPLFGKKEYPLFSVVDRLLDLPGAKSGKFNILIWADNRNRIETDPYGRTSLDYELGYSSKEEAFLNELALRGDRWRYEKVFDASDVANSFQKKHFDALVIIAEDLRALALKAVHYLDKIPQGPRTVILGFPKRDLDSSYLYGVWFLPQEAP